MALPPRAKFYHTKWSAFGFLHAHKYRLSQLTRTYDNISKLDVAAGIERTYGQTRNTPFQEMARSGSGQ